jgi:propanediol dehydratase large subunit
LEDLELESYANEICDSYWIRRMPRVVVAENRQNKIILQINVQDLLMMYRMMKRRERMMPGSQAKVTEYMGSPVL